MNNTELVDWSSASLYGDVSPCVYYKKYVYITFCFLWSQGGGLIGSNIPCTLIVVLSIGEAENGPF